VAVTQRHEVCLLGVRVRVRDLLRRSRIAFGDAVGRKIISSKLFSARGGEILEISTAKKSENLFSTKINSGPQLSPESWGEDFCWEIRRSFFVGKNFNSNKRGTRKIPRFFYSKNQSDFLRKQATSAPLFKQQIGASVPCHQINLLRYVVVLFFKKSDGF